VFFSPTQITALTKDIMGRIDEEARMYLETHFGSPTMCDLGMEEYRALCADMMNNLRFARGVSVEMSRQQGMTTIELVLSTGPLQVNLVKNQAYALRVY